MKNDSSALSKEALSHRTYVENLLSYYKENDIQQGDPDEGKWESAHYPLPKRLGGLQTVELLVEHHAVQGVLQSEEFGICCTTGRYDGWLRGSEYEKLYLKWMSSLGAEGGKKGGARAFELHGKQHVEPAAAARRKRVVVVKADYTKEFKSLTEACKELSLSKSAMSRVISGERSHHKGYTAYYV